MSKHDEHADMIADCERWSEKLTDWELQFIDSISRQVAQGRALTEKQAEKLDAVWERVT